MDIRNRTTDILRIVVEGASAAIDPGRAVRVEGGTVGSFTLSDVDGSLQVNLAQDSIDGGEGGGASPDPLIGGHGGDGVEAVVRFTNDLSSGVVFRFEGDSHPLAPGGRVETRRPLAEVAVGRGAGGTVHLDLTFG